MNMMHQLAQKHIFGHILPRNNCLHKQVRTIYKSSCCRGIASDDSQVTIKAVRNEEIDWLDKNIQLKNHKYRYNTFRSLIDYRRDQARNSLLVQVKSIESANELNRYCNANIGAVKQLYYYENETNKEFQNFFIVEFEDVSSVGKAMFDVAGFGEAPQCTIPISSPFMWFSSDRSSSDRSHLKDNPSRENIPLENNCTNLVVSQTEEQREARSSKNKLNNYLLGFSDLDEQIRAYYELMKITDVGTRLRFLACEQIELALTGMFPNIEALPFGSSVNSFGNYNSDLDMCLKLTKENKDKGKTPSRLMFHTKGSRHGQGSRQQIQKYCDQIAQLIKNFLPGCQDINYILHARVPIIKYRQELIGVDCDVSFATSGHQMSELLYLYGELDNRVRPLVYAIRHWAKDQRLVENERPTVFFTNFEITLMVIFFLQNHYGMLPPLNKLFELADPSVDEYICNDGVNCTFLRDISGLQPDLNKHWMLQPIIDGNKLYSSPTVPLNSGQPISIKEIMKNFYSFYATFNFQKNNICIRSGQISPREYKKNRRSTNTESVVIVNPLEPDLNAASNIKERAVLRFKKACKTSLKRLEELENPSTVKKLKCESVSELSYIFGAIEITTDEMPSINAESLKQNLKKVISDNLFSKESKETPTNLLYENKVQTKAFNNDSTDPIHEIPENMPPINFNQVNEKSVEQTSQSDTNNSYTVKRENDRNSKRRKNRQNSQSIAGVVNQVLNQDLGKSITDSLNEGAEKSEENKIIINRHNTRKRLKSKESINLDVKEFFQK